MTGEHDFLRDLDAALGTPQVRTGSNLEQPFTPDTGERHTIRARTTDHGTEYVCTCGQWDGWAKGPRATQFVHRQFADHKTLAEQQERAETAARQQRQAIIDGEVPGD